MKQDNPSAYRLGIDKVYGEERIIEVYWQKKKRQDYFNHFLIVLILTIGSYVLSWKIMSMIFSMIIIA